MFKAIIIIVIVLAVLIGGLMTLRNSARTGVPGEEVLRRARQRELDLEEAEKRQKED